MSVPVGARGIEPRYSCSQGTRITGFLDAVQFGEKESNLHYLGQGQEAYRLADPRMIDTALSNKFGEKESNLHAQFQGLRAYH